jgi:ectoine hydroxylase-related dioxygenase (phytanoyl-CoA dioxygenase family)
MVHPETRRSDSPSDRDGAIVDRYEADGFAVVPGLFDPAEIAEVREALDQLFSAYRELPPGHRYDLDDEPTGGGVGKIPGIRDTLRLKPHLRASRGLASAVAWAERLLGPGAEVLWDAAIYKPPGSSSETPWHQDEAVYLLSGKRKPRSLVYFWVALDEVDDACGTIRFLPGSHRRPLQPHGWRNGRPGSSLMAEGPVRAEDAVTVALGAGDATVHHARTMHGSGPNGSDRCRKAWILGVGRPWAPRWIRRVKHQVLKVIKNFHGD